MFTPTTCFSKLKPLSSLAMLSSYVNTPFASAHNNEKLTKSFQSAPNGVFADKCHLFLSPYSNTEIGY